MTTNPNPDPAHGTSAPTGGGTPGGTTTARTGAGEAGAAGSWARGGAVFAAVLLLVYGAVSVLNGIAAIAEDDVYERVGDYVYRFDLTAWGWIHLLIGVALIVTGAGVLSGGAWARGLGIGMAAFSIVANFVWLPYQPIWGVIAIALGVFVIWALATDRTGSTGRTA